VSMFGGVEAFRLHGTVAVDTSKVEQGLNQLHGQVKKSGGIIQNAMGTALGFLGGGYMKSVIDTGVGFLKGAAIDYNAAMEQASIGFTTLLGSAEEAQAFIADMEAFAAKTPFDFPSLQTAANQMLAMGFSANEVLPILGDVGDAVAALGLGSDAVGRATFALGQMKAAGKVTAQDMMQLTSMGIPAWKLLADSMGKSVAEVRKLSEQGLIPADKAIKAITDGIRKGPMGGMMAEQAKTFKGAMSTILDSVNMAAGKALRPFFDLVSKGAQGLATWLGTDEAKRFFDGISAALATILDIGGRVFGVVGDLAGGFLGMVKSAGGLGDALGIAVKALRPLATAAGKVVRGVQLVVEAFTGAGAGSIEFTEAVTGLGDRIMKFITDLIDTVPVLLADLAGRFVAWIAPMIPEVLAALGNLVVALGTWVMEQIPVLLGKLGAWAGAFVDWIGPMIPVFLERLLQFVEAGVNWLVSTGIPSFVKGLGKMARELVAWVGPQVPVLLGKLGDLLVKVVSWVVTEGVPRLLQAALKLGGAIVKGVIDLLLGSGGQPGLVQSFVTFVTRDLVPGLLSMGATLLKAAIDLGGQIVKGVIDGLASLPGKIWDAVEDAFRSLRIDIGPFHITSQGITVDLPNIKLPSFAVGAYNIPQDMVAQVHKSEMILPADIASRLRQAGGPIGASGAGLAVAAGAGGGTTIVVNIGTFYGTQANIDALSRSLAERAKAARF